MADPSPSLRYWQETGLDYQLRLCFERLAADARGDRMVAAMPARLRDPSFALPMLFGFGEGFAGGARARFLVWKEDLAKIYEAARQIVLADHTAVAKLFGTTLLLSLSAGLREFFVRPWVENIPGGLSPKTEFEVRRLIELHEAGPLVDWLSLLDESLGGVKFAQAVGILADDIAVSLVATSTARLRQILSEADPEKMGQMIGQPIGAGAVEIFRLIAEPPALDLAQLVAALALSGDELARLGLD